MLARNIGKIGASLNFSFQPKHLSSVSTKICRALALAIVFLPVSSLYFYMCFTKADFASAYMSAKLSNLTFSTISCQFV